MNTARKFPRTLEEAFGPYARGGIYEAPTPMSSEDKLIVGVCVCGLVAVLSAIVLGVL